MAQVYRAIDTILEREVAVKLINPELRAEPEIALASFGKKLGMESVVALVRQRDGRLRLPALDLGRRLGRLLPLPGVLFLNHELDLPAVGDSLGFDHQRRALVGLLEPGRRLELLGLNLDASLGRADCDRGGELGPRLPVGADVAFDDESDGAAVQ